MLLVSTKLLYSQQQHGALVPNINTPLHRFLQNNFDTTIIYLQSSSHYPLANYKIMTKKAGFINFFTYQSPYYGYSEGRIVPGGLFEKFINESQRFKATLPDTNRYFLPTTMPYNVINDIWHTVNAIVWNLESDTSKGNCYVDNDVETNYCLITKNNIKEIEFYSLTDKIKSCPPNTNRQNAANAREAILKTFK